MIRNVPIKLWERKPYRRFINPTDIIYPCILYLPINDVIGQDKDETTVWNCDTKKWEKKVSYKRYKLIFNVYGRNFSCVVRHKYKIGDMKFVYLDKGYDNNGVLSLATMYNILEYEFKMYKSLQVRILSIRECDLWAEKCYCKADIQFLSRYTSETLKIDNVKFIGSMYINEMPPNTIGMEIGRAPFNGYWLDVNDILFFCVSSFETPKRHIELKKTIQTNNTDNWLIYNTDKLILPIIAIVFIILLLIFI